jgi:DNA-binding Lrp family transcriptional regulator
MAAHSLEEESSVSLLEAAARLGLSVDTVRRRVKAGMLPARKVPTRYGPAWRVLLIGPLQQAAERPPAPATSDVSTVEALRLVERLHQQVAELAERVGYLQARLQQAEAALRGWTEGAPPSTRTS